MPLFWHVVICSFISIGGPEICNRLAQCFYRWYWWYPKKLKFAHIWLFSKQTIMVFFSQVTCEMFLFFREQLVWHTSYISFRIPVWKRDVLSIVTGAVWCWSVAITFRRVIIRIVWPTNRINHWLVFITVWILLHTSRCPSRLLQVHICVFLPICRWSPTSWVLRRPDSPTVQHFGSLLIPSVHCWHTGRLAVDCFVPVSYLTCCTPILNFLFSSM